MKKKTLFSLALILVAVITVTGCETSGGKSSSAKEYLNGCPLEEQMAKQDYKVLYTYKLFGNETINVYDNYYWTIKIINANQKLKNITLDGFKLEYKSLVELYKDIKKVDSTAKILNISDNELNTKKISNNNSATISYSPKTTRTNAGQVSITYVNTTGQDVALKDAYPTNPIKIVHSDINGYDMHEISFGEENAQQKIVDILGKPYAVKTDRPTSKTGGLNLLYYYKIGDHFLLQVGFKAYLENNEIKYGNGEFGAFSLIPYDSDTTADKLIGIKESKTK